MMEVKQFDRVALLFAFPDWKTNTGKNVQKADSVKVDMSTET